MNTDSFTDLPLGTHLHFQSVDSTNSAAKRIKNLQEEDALPLLITCDQQTAGRGRGNNRWLFTPGNLAFSIVVDSANWTAQQTAWLGLWTAVSLLKCAKRFLPDERCQLKWPNDLVINDRKNAGILIESIPGSSALVCGIGLNLVQLPPESQQEIENHPFAWAESDGWIKSAEQSSTALDRVAVLRYFLGIWLKLEFLTESDQAKILNDFADHDWLLHQQIEILANGETITGQYAGLSPKGHLQLRSLDAADTICTFVSCERVRRCQG